MTFLVIIILTSTYQALQCQPINGIPLEALEGFKKDSFTLPSDSFAQPVFKLGIYQSKVTTNLVGVGKVYVHHFLQFSQEYSYMEIYSRKPSSGFIQGIKRYGNFRMYEHYNIAKDSFYNGEPKIEFVRGLDSIISTVNLLPAFNITNGKDMEYSGELNDPNYVKFSIDDCSKYVDPIIIDSLKNAENGADCNFIGWIQYDMEDKMVKAELCLGASDLVLWTFETIIYDTSGALIGRVNGYGPLRYLNLTENHRFVYSNTGGGVTEDYWAPYIFRIIDLKTDEIIFSKRSTTNELWGFAIPNSNLGVYLVKEQFGGPYSELESYVIDHSKGVMYILHLNPLCKPPTHTTFYPTYCECYMANGPISKLYYAKDFTSIRFN